MLGKNLTKYFSSCSERFNFNGPRLYIESKGVLLEFWLALAEGVDGCWEMKIWFD